MGSVRIYVYSPVSNSKLFDGSVSSSVKNCVKVNINSSFPNLNGLGNFIWILINRSVIDYGDDIV